MSRNPHVRSLAGFEEDWERALFKGRELKANVALAEQGVGSGAEIVTVRRLLIADGWKLKIGDDLDDDSDSEEEAF